MANLVIPRREIWTQQPQGTEGIDWSNPITNGIASVLNPASGLRDHITGELWTPFGAKPKPGVGPKGRLFDSTSDFGGYALISSRNLATPAQTHLLFVEYVTKSASYSGLFGSASANGSSPSLILQDLGSGFGVYPGSPGSLSSNSAFGPSVILISGDANNSDGYKDGVAFLTGAPAVVPQATASLRVFGERAMNPSYSTKGRVYLSISWTRRLTASEKLAVSENPWQIFAPRETRLFVPVSAGGGSTVTSDASATYKVLGSLQSNATASYAVRSAVQSASSASYSVRGSLQQSIVSDYGIRTSTQQNAASTYAVRGLVAQDVAPTYSIRGSVSSDTTAAYNILSASSVSASASAGYNIRGNVNQDVAAIYALRGSVTQDTSATYSILSASAVSSSVTAGYAIKGSVQSSIVAGYSIAQTVQAEIAASYVIRAGAVSEAQAAYVIRGLVQQSIAASYAIDGTAFTGSISDADIARIVQAVLLQLNNESIAAAVLAALNATTIPVDMKKTNGITIMGTGSKLSPWRPA